MAARPGGQPFCGFARRCGVNLLYQTAVLHHGRRRYRRRKLKNRYPASVDVRRINGVPPVQLQHDPALIPGLRSWLSHRFGCVVTLATWTLLAACASPRSVTVPDSALPLSHDEVTTLLGNATVHGYVNGFSTIMKTHEDGSLQYHVQPGKEHFAHASDVVHATGTWHVLETGQFCVSLSWGSSASSKWCRYIFHSDAGYGASNSATGGKLDSWNISAN
jgi:hypothetical protein